MYGLLDLAFSRAALVIRSSQTALLVVCVPFFVLSILGVVAADPAIADAPEITLQFYFVDGRVIAAGVNEDFLDWTHVTDDGQAKKIRIRLADIKKLVLAETRAALQVAQIRQLVEQLGDDDYGVRQAAEKTLSDPDFSGAFYDQIKRRSNDSRLEVRYRLRRVLAKLDDRRTQAPLSFDALVLKNGEVMQGDAGAFEWSGVFQGRPLALRRDELALIAAGRRVSVAAPAERSLRVETNVFQDYRSFGIDNYRKIDFSLDPNGNRLSQGHDVENTFVPWGLQFTTESQGYIGIPTYSMPEENAPVGGNSITRFNDRDGRGLPYKGVTEFVFCLPNQPKIPAGVNDFGTFIGVVDSPRSFVLEGYDQHGNLVGLVESATSRCGFLGIKTSVPMHRIRIRSNPFLYRVDESMDEDYVLDTFCFSEPQPVATPVSRKTQGGQTQLVVLNDGTRLTGKIDFLPGKKIRLRSKDVGPFEISLDRVSEIGLAASVKVDPKRWFATLDNGCSVSVYPTDGFESEWLGKIAVEQINSLHNTSNPKRYPLAGDFELGKAVLVYPTCRIPLAKIGLSEQRVSWSKDATKLLQPVDETSPLGVPGKDPTPQVSKVDFSHSTADEIPTIWLKQPRRLNSGYVRLTDGQVLALLPGRDLQFLSNGLVVATTATGKLKIPLRRIASILFADRLAPSK